MTSTIITNIRLFPYWVCWGDLKVPPSVTVMKTRVIKDQINTFFGENEKGGTGIKVIRDAGGSCIYLTGKMASGFVNG